MPSLTVAHALLPGRRAVVDGYAGLIGGIIVALLPLATVQANTWVFEPSISLDQRFDDNYRLETGIARKVSATRLVGDLGLSRESRIASIRGGARIDALLTQGEYDGDELDSNQVLFLDTDFGSERTKWGVDFSYKQDTPSRDIAADLSEDDSEALDSGVVTQRSNVGRHRLEISPSLTHELTRRSSLQGTIDLIGVVHALPDSQDAIYTRYLQLYNNPNRAEDFPIAEDGSPLPIDQVTIAEAGGVFTPNGELDDYSEAKLTLTYRYALSPISSISTIASTSYYVADVEADDVTFDQLDREGDLDIYRRPRGRDAISTTQTFKLGYDRDLTSTLKGGIQAGLYYNTTDETDIYRPSDRPDLAYDEARLDDLKSNANGWLAKVTLAKDAGLTRYSGSFGVDVQPSSIGTQVEVQELIVDAVRTLSPRLDASVRLRAYEPDRLGANPDDRFARRFLSVEPKITWRITRAWAGAASYRYRRQKSRVETESGESNALLFSLRYTPPSAIRDAARSGS